MALMTGVYIAKKKDSSIYYRASVTYKNKHISLGSYDTETDANTVYLLSKDILSDFSYTINNYSKCNNLLSYDKYITLINFRDNGIYIKNPIYIYKSFFLYYISSELCLKFDVDDLFYYSEHKIIKRGGHLFTSDYGMQVNILSRYGIKNYAVLNKDYYFLNGDCNDFRYDNIKIINKYHGVSKTLSKGIELYVAKVHIVGNIIIGKYSSETEAAIAYNKAVDILTKHGINKKFPQNYIVEINSIEYAKIYNSVKISRKIYEYKL